MITPGLAVLSHFFERTRCPTVFLDALAPSPATPEPRPALPPGSLHAAREQVNALLERARRAAHDVPSLNEIERAIDWLRHERYLDNSITESKQSEVKALVRKAYYLLRPALPVALRKHLQRAALRDWESIAFPRWPVDTSVEDLIDATWRLLLKATGRDELPFIWYWPEGHASACMMTHDVETPVGRDFCDSLMRMERRIGLVSAFEVVPEERYPVPATYLQSIRDQGCEVCIHGLNHDGRLFTSDEIFFGRAPRINAYAEQWGARGFRSPVMYRNLDWLYALQFSYDMSVPNVGHLDPQRGGACTVLPYFIGDMLELPLTTIQDYSLFNIVQSRSTQLWERQMGVIRARHGLISFIVHPDYVNEPWSSAVYERLLDRIAVLRDDEGVWVALPREVDDWWRARRDMRLVEDVGGWRIQGPQAQRAALAFATLDGDRIVYRLAAARATEMA
jgi:hypothetical protein